MKLTKRYIKKNLCSSVSAQKLKCPVCLDSARKLFSSARLSSGNFSSNSSLLATYLSTYYLLKGDGKSPWNPYSIYVMDQFLRTTWRLKSIYPPLLGTALWVWIKLLCLVLVAENWCKSRLTRKALVIQNCMLITERT